MKQFFLSALRYGVTPVFLILAILNFVLAQRGGGHSVHVSEDIVAQTQEMGHMVGHMHHTMTDPGLWESILTHPVTGSMWLMYLLMGIAHIGPWLGEKSCNCK